MPSTCARAGADETHTSRNGYVVALNGRLRSLRPLSMVPAIVAPAPAPGLQRAGARSRVVVAAIDRAMMALRRRDLCQ
jgi:hypothetical protein